MLESRRDFSDSRYSAITFSLEDGDRVALITDGLIEAKDSSEKEFGMERLRQIVDSTHSLSAGMIDRDRSKSRLVLLRICWLTEK